MVGYRNMETSNLFLICKGTITEKTPENACNRTLSIIVVNETSAAKQQEKKKAFKFHSGTTNQDGEIDSLVKLLPKLGPKLCGLKLQNKMDPNFFWKNQIVFEIIFQTQFFFPSPNSFLQD